jgi:hypothetical protein
VAVVALTTVPASATAAHAASASGASGSSKKPTICVALVVDGRSLGSNVTTTCAKVPKGSTGVDVLEAGGHSVSFRNDGLLCTIDGLPKSGCAGVDDTHYWAYFHRAPGSTKWVYSSEGASTYQPVNDSTEGWVYDNGKSLTPENVPYSQICTTKTSPKPTTSPSPHRSATPPPASATATSTPATTPTPTPSHSRRHRSPRPHHSSSPVGPTSAISASSSPRASTTSAALAGAIKPPANHHGWLDLLIGLIVVAAVGIAALVRFRRTPR